MTSVVICSLYDSNSAEGPRALYCRVMTQEDRHSPRIKVSKSSRIRATWRTVSPFQSQLIKLKDSLESESAFYSIFGILSYDVERGA